MTENDLELRQYCLDKAVASGAGENALKVAEDMYNFLKGTSAPQPTTLKTAAGLNLSATQIKALKTMKAMEDQGKIVNGTYLAQQMDISQSNASALIRKLKDLGFVLNEGYKYWLNRENSAIKDL